MEVKQPSDDEPVRLKKRRIVDQVQQAHQEEEEDQEAHQEEEQEKEQEENTMYYQDNWDLDGVDFLHGWGEVDKGDEPSTIVIKPGSSRFQYYGGLLAHFLGPDVKWGYFDLYDDVRLAIVQQPTSLPRNDFCSTLFKQDIYGPVCIQLGDAMEGRDRQSIRKAKALFLHLGQN